MPTRIYRLPTASGEIPLSILAGAVFAAGLFIVMALAQMMGRVELKPQTIDEMVIAYQPPEVLEIEEDEIPPPEDEVPPPELEEEPPLLSLAQLDIALNPGTGGSLTGDFALPTIGTSQRDLGTEDFVDFSDLDQMPRPIGVTGFDFPRSLRRKPVSGRIVLFIQIDATGDVLDVRVDSSNLPAFDSFVSREVAKWPFTPPTQQGRPVKAQARLPIPINIR
jgi:protein TonB